MIYKLCQLINLGEEPINLKRIENIIEFLKDLDCAFPVLRGKGEMMVLYKGY